MINYIHLTLKTKVYHPCMPRGLTESWERAWRIVQTDADFVNNMSVILRCPTHNMRPRYSNADFVNNVSDRAWRVCTPTLDLQAMLDTLGLLLLLLKL